MEINEFVAKFAEQFDETDSSEIKSSTVFHDLDEWSSIIALSVVAFIYEDYGKTVSILELKSCVTVEDIFNLIINR